ncbi:uncharacterized protein LOC144160665 [Haemaphysalis longicornis]
MCRSRDAIANKQRTFWERPLYAQVRQHYTEEWLGTQKTREEQRGLVDFIQKAISGSLDTDSNNGARRVEHAGPVSSRARCSGRLRAACPQKRRSLAPSLVRVSGRVRPTKQNAQPGCPREVASASPSPSPSNSAQEERLASIKRALSCWLIETDALVREAPGRPDGCAAASFPSDGARREERVVGSPWSCAPPGKRAGVVDLTYAPRMGLLGGESS